MGIVIKSNEILLNGVRYPTIGQVQPAIVSQLPAKVVMGDYSMEDGSEASVLVLNDFKGGLGIENWDESAGVDRYWWGEAETRFHGHLLCAPLESYAEAFSVLPAVSSNVVYFNDKLWAGRGAKLYYSSTATGVINQTNDPYFDVDDDITWLGVDTKYDTLIIFCGDTTNYYYMGTDEVVYQSNSAAATIGCFSYISASHVLYKMSAEGVMKSCVNPGSATPTWNSAGGLERGTNFVKSLLIYRDVDASPMMYASTEEGLFAYDSDLATWFETELQFPRSTNAGKSCCRWRDSLYVASGMDILKYTIGGTATIQSVGLSQDDGVPTEAIGTVAALFGEYNALYAAITPTDTTSTGVAYIAAYDGGGWRIACTKSVTEQPVFDGSMIVAEVNGVYALNAPFHFSDHHGTAYIMLDRYVVNPLRIGAYEYATTSNLITPWFDGNWTVGTKLALRAKIRFAGIEWSSQDPNHGDMSATSGIRVYYRLNREDESLATGWTELFHIWPGAVEAVFGEGETRGELEYTFGTDEIGLEFSEIQFKIALRRKTDTDNTHSPDMQALTFSYIKAPAIAWGYRCVVDCTKDYDTHTAAQLLETLVEAAETIPLIEFTYTKNDTSTETKKVKIRTMQGTVNSGEQHQGIYTIFMTAP